MINIRHLIFIFSSLVGAFGLSSSVIGQSVSVSGQSSLATIVSQSDRQPFYFWANQLGQVSAGESLNVLARFSATAHYQLPNDRQSVFAGVNLNLRQTRQTDALLPELYGGFQSRYLEITAGLFADSLRVRGLSPSNGQFMSSRNAAPHPRIRLGTKGFIQLGQNPIYVAGFYEEGLLGNQRIVQQAKLHHKNLSFRVGRPQGLEFTVGFDHFVFWGGSTDDADYPQTLKAYFRAILANQEYLERLDMMNVVGNQLGQYQFTFRKSFDRWTGTLQIAHPFEDYSGVYFENYPDNMYTFLVELNKTRLIQQLLVEYTHSKHQSGDPKYNADNELAGGDSYFAHSQYRSGFTHKGLPMGSPLFVPIQFNEQGMAESTQNNRLSAYHLGIKGSLSNALNYQLMLTYSKNYGRYAEPFEPARNQFFSLASLRYSGANWNHLFIETNLALDAGDLWSGATTHEAGVSFNVGWLF